MQKEKERVISFERPDGTEYVTCVIKLSHT
jgi:hypothetical protein